VGLGTGELAATLEEADGCDTDGVTTLALQAVSSHAAAMIPQRRLGLTRRIRV
jgi:hypothetical protein